MIRGLDAGRRRVHVQGNCEGKVGLSEEKQPVYRFSVRATGSDKAIKLLNDLGKPRVEALHPVDVLGLVTSGMLLGVGFFGLMGRLNFASSQKDQSKPPRNE
jgi:hypothetical protein